jgi:exportin-7
VAELLQCHTPDYFPFLADPDAARQRTTFYSSLARLVFFEDESERFEPFVAPLLASLDALAGAVTQRSDGVMRALSGACRDWRGVAAAAHNRASYVQVFEALLPRLETLTRGLAVYHDVTDVTTPLLKLMSELVLQRGQRVSFGNNSPNGVLLFRAASTCVNTFLTSPTAMHQFSPEDPSAYAKKYKAVNIAATIMSRALDGGFLNFGVLKLYSDPSLDQSTGVLLQALLSIPPDVLFAYTKVAGMYMVIMHLLMRSHIDFMVSLPPAGFLHIANTLIRGLDSVDVEVASHASCAIDFLATYYVKNVAKDAPSANALKAQLRANPRIFHDFMLTLFRVLVFDESSGAATTTMSLIRPLLPVILAAQLIQPTALEEYKSELVMSQPEERRARMAQRFDELAADVTK